MDSAVLRALAARRRLLERDADGKLALLRRLERQKVLRDLPETRVEQSFNEQLFARVLGYRTLLSHDQAIFHLLPKNLTGPHRYDDFSIGFFGGDADVVYASTEFKGPGVDLDAPQRSGAHAGETPVQQAFAAARTLPSCRWVLVSNFRDLRLYRATDPTTPLARVDLFDVRTRDDLALLLVHFDRDALLPRTPDDGDEPEMTLALDPQSPGAPLPRADGSFRVIVRFTPATEALLPLDELERRLRKSVETAGDRDYFFRLNEYDEPKVTISMRQGWVWTEGPKPNRSVRIAVNRLGEARVSARFPVGKPLARVDTLVDTNAIIHTMTLFLRVCADIQGFDVIGGGSTATVTATGHVGLELREVAGTVFEVSNYGANLQLGKTEEETVVGGDFPTDVPRTIGHDLASCLGEVAVQFRGQNGGVLLDPQAENLVERANRRAE